MIEWCQFAPQEADGGRGNKRARHRPFEPLSLDPSPLASKAQVTAARHGHGGEKKDHQADEPDDDPPIEGQAIAPASVPTSLRRSALSTVSTMLGALSPASSYCFCGASWSWNL